MKSANISELRNHLSKLLRFVRQGEPIRILDRGVPIAEIQPLSKRRSRSNERLDLLEAKGMIRRGTPKRLRTFPFPENGKTGVLQALLEERESGR